MSRTEKLNVHLREPVQELELVRNDRARTLVSLKLPGLPQGPGVTIGQQARWSPIDWDFGRERKGKGGSRSTASSVSIGSDLRMGSRRSGFVSSFAGLNGGFLFSLLFDSLSPLLVLALVETSEAFIFPLFQNPNPIIPMSYPLLLLSHEQRPENYRPLRDPELTHPNRPSNSSVNIWLIVKSIEFFSIPSIDQDFGMQIELIKLNCHFETLSLCYASRSSASPPYSKSRVRDRRSRSLSGSRRSRSRSRDSVGAVNPGNNLYVTGLSTRVTSSELEKYFSREGKVTECQLVADPHTKESRGFAFVTMETKEDAERCIKHLNRSVLEGRLITVEMAKRKRGRTPTPGRYQGLRDKRGLVSSFASNYEDATTHLPGGMREILVPVKAEEEHAPRTVEGAMMITLTRMGGVVVVATEERINSTRLSTTSHFKFSTALVVSWRQLPLTHISEV
ncbi:hypothetical protein RHGRI_005890 [Rhododendron griersonianum]|uniref:RRM domain-containing protein n=1 Tax=Rhododendron griersonianum TaxID=479676 RepID=A0AAV6LG04_9ERIC|nr:hypothetical protein RHGRI_005890 [Rhododendron griersonianum]